MPHTKFQVPEKKIFEAFLLLVKAPDEGKPSKITLGGHLFSRNLFRIVV